MQITLILYCNLLAYLFVVVIGYCYVENGPKYLLLFKSKEMMERELKDSVQALKAFLGTTSG